MRAEIDVLRMERVNFDQVYKKMERDLAAKKREMSDVIEISNIAYEARDQAHNAPCCREGDRELRRVRPGGRELSRILDHDRKMKEAEMRNRLRAAELGVDFPGGDDDLEAKLRKKGIKGNWAVDAGAKAIDGARGGVLGRSSGDGRRTSTTSSRRSSPRRTRTSRCSTS